MLTPFYRLIISSRTDLAAYLMNKIKNQLCLQKLPKHIVLIMDGNGRWARQRNLDRLSGHREGMKSVSSVVKAARELGINYITLFAFSAQNWNRPREEVVALMNLLKQFLSREGDELVDKGIKLNAIGRLHDLPPDVREVLEEVISRTSKCSEMTLTLALSYGGREEIIDAVNDIISKNSVKKVDENYFRNSLYTKGLPEPDLLIRTSGEMRLSNFLLWQLAYTEIYVTKTLWPNFRRRHFIRALINFQKRERRFGLTSDQLDKET